MQIPLRRAVAMFTVLSCSVWAQADDIYFQAQADEPIATLTREHGMVRGVADEPLVAVYGSGLVRVHRASYMINPGVTEYRLDHAALNTLIDSLSGTFGMSSDELKRERDEAVAARAADSGEMFFTLDSTTTKITVALDGFSRDGAQPVVVNTSIAFADVQEQAQRYELASLQSLAKAENALLALMTTTSKAEGVSNEK
ncbi:MAG: hypothetical protein AB8G16_10805 [Gammaproteobacteria bacterium]